MARKSIATLSPINYWAGPFVDGNDNIYVVCENLSVYKAGSNPLVDSWTAQDTSNEPTSDTTAGVGSWQDGTKIHIVHWDATSGQFRYSVFRTSDDTNNDTWGTIDQTIEAPIDPGTARCAITIRSDGDIIVGYNGDKDKIHGTSYDRVDYAREEGSGWNDVGISLGAVDQEVTQQLTGIGIGESDKVFFSYRGYISQIELIKQILTSSNSLGTLESIQSSSTTLETNNKYIPYYDDSGVEVMTWGYHIGSNQIAMKQTRDDSLQTAVNGDTSEVYTDAGYPSPVADGTDIYLTYRQTSTNDIYYQKSSDGGAFGSTTFVSSASAPVHISANIIDHGGGKVLAVVYNDSGTVYYDEVSLGVTEPLVAAIDGSALVAPLLSVQAPLAVALDASALLVGDFILIKKFATTIDGSALVTADLTQTKALATALDGSALVEPDIIRNKLALFGSIDASGLLVGNFNRTRLLDTAITGSGNVSANLSRLLSLTVDITSDGLLVGDITRTRSLATAITGSALLVGNFNRTRSFVSAIILTEQDHLFQL
jgi:hypothetical protein